MASWPSSLPQNMRLPVNHSYKDSRLKTKMDSGPNKVRRRYTAAEQPVSTSMQMDGSQYKDLWDFYNGTLNGGVERFEWDSPKDDTIVEMRFVKPPEGEIISGGDSDNRTWFVVMELEIMP